MALWMLHYKTPDEGAHDVVRAVEAAFAALAERRPAGVRFEYFRRAGSGEFFALLELADGVDNPLPTIEAARALQSIVGERAIGGPPTPAPVERLGSFGSLSA